jgi:two-component system LytT family response regulator
MVYLKKQSAFNSLNIKPLKTNFRMSGQKIIKVIIVDDMPPAREGLRLQLEMLDNIEVVGEAADVEHAMEMILDLKPQLVFLDVNLPGKTGFDLLDDLKKHPELDLDIIFVTGYAEHAIKSFDYYPYSFLLKPVAGSKLKEVLARYFGHLFRKDFDNKLNAMSNSVKRLEFKSENSWLCLNYNEILWFKADRNYTEIYLKNGLKETVSESLGNIEKMLNGTTFFRSHRSFIINYSNVIKIGKPGGKLILRSNPFNDMPLVAKENIQELIRLIAKME